MGDTERPVPALNNAFPLGAVLQAYGCRGLLAPPVRCHLARKVATSWAALSVPLAGICAVAAWVSSCMFALFYRVDVAASHPVATAVLSASSTCN